MESPYEELGNTYQTLGTLFQSKEVKVFKVKKPRKDEQRIIYIERLHEITGWTKRGLTFQFKGLPESWIKDAITYCQHYATQSTRGYKLKEFLNELKK
jgi:hypothetical protein